MLEELEKEIKYKQKLVQKEKARLRAEAYRRAKGVKPKAPGMSTEERKARSIELSRSLVGKLRRIYNSQLRNSRSRGHSKPEYTLEEFIDKYSDDPKYKVLHANWVKSGYEKALAPSFDRLDDSKGYSFDNLQVVTWKRNNTKAHEDMRSSKLINAHKTIYRFKDGVVTEFKSSAEAEKITGIGKSSILNVVNGHSKKTRDGSIWTNDKEKIDECIAALNEAHGLSKPVLQYNTEGEFIAEHRSTPEAAENVGLKSSSNIRAVCDGRRKTAGGFVWKYKDLP